MKLKYVRYFIVAVLVATFSGLFFIFSSFCVGMLIPSFLECKNRIYDKIMWDGKTLIYPEQVLGGPAIYDPKHILDDKEKEHIREILQEHWNMHRCVLYVCIDDKYINSRLISDWINKIPYYRSKAIMFYWNKYEQQWKSYTIKMKFDKSFKRKTFMPEIAFFYSKHEIMEGTSLDPTWVNAQICKVLDEDRKFR